MKGTSTWNKLPSRASARPVRVRVLSGWEQGSTSAMFKRRSKISVRDVGPIMVLHSNQVTKTTGEETQRMLAELKANADDMQRCLEDIELEKKGAGGWESVAEDEDDDKDEEDPTVVPAEKLAGWEVRKAKYIKYAEKGRVRCAPVITGCPV